MPNLGNQQIDPQQFAEMMQLAQQMNPGPGAIGAMDPTGQAPFNLPGMQGGMMGGVEAPDADVLPVMFKGGLKPTAESVSMFVQNRGSMPDEELIEYIKRILSNVTIQAKKSNEKQMEQQYG